MPQLTPPTAPAVAARPTLSARFRALSTLAAAGEAARDALADWRRNHAADREAGHARSWLRVLDALRASHDARTRAAALGLEWDDLATLRACPPPAPAR